MWELAWFHLTHLLLMRVVCVCVCVCLCGCVTQLDVLCVRHSPAVQTELEGMCSACSSLLVL